MYFRYTVSYFDSKNNSTGSGIFRAADHVRDHTDITAEEKKELQSLIEWFDDHLPVPGFYDDPSVREGMNIYFWYKDSVKGEVIEKMKALLHILEENGVSVKLLTSESLPGTVVFEDEYQVAITPFEGEGTNMK